MRYSAFSFFCLIFSVVSQAQITRQTDYDFFDNYELTYQEGKTVKHYHYDVPVGPGAYTTSGAFTEYTCPPYQTYEKAMEFWKLNAEYHDGPATGVRREELKIAMDNINNTYPDWSVWEDLCWIATEYKRGHWTCDASDLTESSKNNGDVDVRAEYYGCLVIQGKDDEGLPNLYILADQPGGWEQNSIDAAYFIASYHISNGELDGQIRIRDSWWTDHDTNEAQTEQEKQRVNKAQEYYMKAWASFRLLTDQSDINEHFFELLWSAHILTLTYFKSSIAYRQHEPYFGPDIPGGDDQGDTLEQVIRYGEECANLPRKSENHPELYEAVITSCRGMVDAAKKLTPLFDKWREILRQPTCKHMQEMIVADPGAEDYNDPDCPEYDEVHREIHSIVDEYLSLAETAFESYRNSRK